MDVNDAANDAVISPIPTDGRPYPSSTFNISYPGVSGSGSPTSPHVEALQESIHQALGGGVVVSPGYGGDETGDEDTDDEDSTTVDAGNDAPLTPPSGYGSTNVVTPTLRRGHRNIPRNDSPGLDELRALFRGPYRRQMERNQGEQQPRPRARGVDHGPGSSASPQIRALQESVHQALGGGVVPPDNLSDGSNNSAGGRGRSERKRWRKRLASSILFGGGGNGAGGSGTGTGPSGQVLQERDD